MLDPAARDYRKAGGAVDPAVAEILAIKNPGREVREAPRASRIRRRSSCGRSSATCSTTAPYHLAAIADNARDVDLALRWGFGWSMGPFEIWQAAGWKEVAGWIAEDIAAGKTLANVAAAGVGERGPGRRRACTRRPARTAPPPTRSARARRCRSIAASTSRIPCWASGGRPGTTIMETPAVRMWHLGDDIGIVSFKSKGNTIGEDVLDGVLRAIERAERECAGLVLWQTKEPFSLGANLVGDRARDPGRAVGRDRGGRRQVPADVAAACATASCRRSPRCAAWRSAARANSSCTATARSPRSSRTSAWSRSASGCCRAAAAARNSPCARRRKSRAARSAARSTSCRSCARISRPIAMAKVSRSASDAKELGYPAPRRRRRVQRATSCCTSRRRRRARWPRPATGRRCRRATSRSPAGPASRRSR